MEEKVIFGFNLLYPLGPQPWTISWFPISSTSETEIAFTTTEQQKVKDLAVQQDHRDPLSIWDVYVAFIWLFSKKFKSFNSKVTGCRVGKQLFQASSLALTFKEMQSSFFWGNVLSQTT